MGDEVGTIFNSNLNRTINLNLFEERVRGFGLWTMYAVAQAWRILFKPSPKTLNNFMDWLSGSTYKSSLPYQEKHFGTIRGYWLPQQSETLIVFIHGGGFALCSFKTHGHFADLLATETGYALFFPEYTRVPEAKFPQALEEIEASLKSLFEEQQYSRMILVGDSAGGNMCLHLANRGNLPIKVDTMLLISPWIHPEESASRLLPKTRDIMILKSEFITYGKWYLGKLEALPTIEIPSGTTVIVSYDEKELLAPQIESFCKQNNLQALVHNSGYHAWPMFWHVLPKSKAFALRIISRLKTLNL